MPQSLNGFSSSPEVNPRKRGKLTTKLAIGGLLCLGWFGPQYWQNHQDYQRGDQAYRQAECQEAISNFQKVIQRDLPIPIKSQTQTAYARTRECYDYLEAVNPEEEGDFPAALLAYNNFINQYRRTGLGNLIHQKARKLLEEKTPDVLVNPVLCQQLDEFLKTKLIWNSAEQFPPLYHACGEAYVQAGDYASALEIYQKFLQLYPQHQLKSDVEIALVQTVIADAEAKGATEIPQPPAVGQTLFGYTEVEIQNDSPTTLRFMFAGAEQSFPDMKPCPECQIYKTQEERPEACPNQGPVQQFKLKPGDYEIVVNSVGKVRTFPFRGQWNLEDGVKYRICFIVVDFPIADKQNDLPGGDRIPADGSQPPGDSELGF